MRGLSVRRGTAAFTFCLGWLGEVAAGSSTQQKTRNISVGMHMTTDWMGKVAAGTTHGNTNSVRQ